MKKNRLILIFSLLFVGLSGVFIISIYLKNKQSKLKNSLVKLARLEVMKWHGLTELSKKVSQTLLTYWKSVGRHFTASEMQSPSVHESYPWSSAFISYLFFKVGAGHLFPYSGRHSTYFQYAKQNRDNKTAPLRGYRVSEYAPKVGDLIIYSRVSGKGYDSTGHFPSHGELVVETARGFIKAIGGNVSNTVKESTYKTDSKGYLKGNRVSFFMVIQNNIR